LWTLFAVVLGTAGLLSQTSAAIFTLSLPVTRRQIVGIRAATGILEIVALAVLPSLAIALLAPAIGQRYAVADALVHGVCLALGGAVFFSLAFLLSTVWSDVWRPALLALGAAIVLGLCEEVSSAAARYGIFHVMSAEEYFRAGHVPWTGLAITLSLSAVMLYGAARNIERRDF
jgi:hypothetical protein